MCGVFEPDFMSKFVDGVVASLASMSLVLN